MSHAMIGVVDPLRRVPDLEDTHDLVTEFASAADLVTANPSIVVGIGEPAIIDLVHAGVDAPVLPADGPRGFIDVSIDEVGAAIEQLARGTYETTPIPLLGLSIGGAPAGQGLLDAMVVRADPARISEYCVVFPDSTTRFRADGVVVATPAGSAGYARAAGGPVIVTQHDALVVVPVGAFAIGLDHWVVSDGSAVTIHVERNEGPVELLLDGRRVRDVPQETPVRVHLAGRLDVIALTDELEKL